MKERNLRIAEHFYSIQGEGQTAGIPAVFLRMSACNLMCGGQGTEKDGKLHDGATWRCDTIETWIHGTKYSLPDALEMVRNKYARQFQQGAHLVITGGEPMLRQKECTWLISELRKNFPRLFVEMETNGTIQPKDALIHQVDLFNISPKTSNSGMPANKRIIPLALRTLVSLAENNQAIFKFVVSDVVDWEEIKQDYVKTYSIPNTKIWLMPACDSREDIAESWSLIGYIVKNAGVKFSPRLQVAIWNQTTGV